MVARTGSSPTISRSSSGDGEAGGERSELAETAGIWSTDPYGVAPEGLGLDCEPNRTPAGRGDGGGDTGAAAARDEGEDDKDNGTDDDNDRHYEGGASSGGAAGYTTLEGEDDGEGSAEVEGLSDDAGGSGSGDSSQEQASIETVENSAEVGGEAAANTVTDDGGGKSRTEGTGAQDGAGQHDDLEASSSGRSAEAEVDDPEPAETLPAPAAAGMVGRPVTSPWVDEDGSDFDWEAEERRERQEEFRRQELEEEEAIHFALWGDGGLDGDLVQPNGYGDEKVVETVPPRWVRNRPQSFSMATGSDESEDEDDQVAEERLRREQDLAGALHRALWGNGGLDGELAAPTEASSNNDDEEAAGSIPAGAQREVAAERSGITAPSSGTGGELPSGGRPPEEQQQQCDTLAAFVASLVFTKLARRQLRHISHDTGGKHTDKHRTWMATEMWKSSTVRDAKVWGKAADETAKLMTVATSKLDAIEAWLVSSAMVEVANWCLEAEQWWAGHSEERQGRR